MPLVAILGISAVILGLILSLYFIIYQDIVKPLIKSGWKGLKIRGLSMLTLFVLSAGVIEYYSDADQWAKMILSWLFAIPIYSAPIAYCWRNKKLTASFFLILVGATLNLIVVSSNGGLMPIFTQDPEVIAPIKRPKTHFLVQEQDVAFPFLADWIDIKIYGFSIVGGIASPGDMFLAAAGVYIAYYFNRGLLKLLIWLMGKIDIFLVKLLSRA